MNYSFKVTTGGRELLAALLATGKELEITRVAIGSGKVAEDVNLADMTDLIQYVAEGTIAQRRHHAVHTRGRYSVGYMRKRTLWSKVRIDLHSPDLYRVAPHTCELHRNKISYRTVAKDKRASLLG